jgi:hypothetical protein
MSGKRYGSESEAPIVPFELNVRHEDPETGREESRWHEFNARPRTDAGGLLALSSTSTGTEQVGVVLRLMNRILLNSDGVPSQWEATVLPVPDDAPEDYEPKFRGPDGVLYPMAEAKRFEEHNAGSSRRRLMSLIEGEYTSVDTTDLTAVLQDMIGSAAGRPTTAR